MVVISGATIAASRLLRTTRALEAMLTVAPTAILDGTENTDTLTWDFNSGTEAFDYLATGETLMLTTPSGDRRRRHAARAIPKRSRSRSPAPTTRRAISGGPTLRHLTRTERH